MIQTTTAQDHFHAALEAVETQPCEQGLAWFKDTRRAAMARFSALGIPNTRQEEWRYTNLSPLAKTALALSPGGERVERADFAERLFSEACCRVVLVNGRFDADLSDLGQLPAGVVVCSMSQACARHPETVRDHLSRHAAFQDDALTALNTALLCDGAFVHIPRGVVVDRPIQILALAAPGTEPLMTHPRNLVVLEESSQAILIETYAAVHDGFYFTNAVTEVAIGDNAFLEHYKIGRESPAAFHVGNFSVTQGRSCNVNSHLINLGGRLVRNDINAVLDGEGSDCTLNGLTMLSGEQHADNHLRIDHAKPRCTSWEYFKGVYDDHSRGVFSGRILVAKDAQRTDAKQTSMSLLLSDHALADSKPQLEIFADDVKCTHGATIGQVDDNAIFYLRSRGLSSAAARSMLIYAFASETISSIRYEPLRQRLQTEVLRRLPQGDIILGSS